MTLPEKSVECPHGEHPCRICGPWPDQAIQALHCSPSVTLSRATLTALLGATTAAFRRGRDAHSRSCICRYCVAIQEALEVLEPSDNAPSVINDPCDYSDLFDYSDDKLAPVEAHNA